PLPAPARADTSPLSLHRSSDLHVHRHHHVVERWLRRYSRLGHRRLPAAVPLRGLDRKLRRLHGEAGETALAVLDRLADLLRVLRSEEPTSELQARESLVCCLRL